MDQITFLAVFGLKPVVVGSEETPQPRQRRRESKRLETPRVEHLARQGLQAQERKEEPKRGQKRFIIKICNICPYRIGKWFDDC